MLKINSIFIQELFETFFSFQEYIYSCYANSYKFIFYIFYDVLLNM